MAFGKAERMATSCTSEQCVMWSAAWGAECRDRSSPQMLHLVAGVVGAGGELARGGDSNWDGASWDSGVPGWFPGYSGPSSLSMELAGWAPGLGRPSHQKNAVYTFGSCPLTINALYAPIVFWPSGIRT